MPRLNVGDRVVIDWKVAAYAISFSNPPDIVQGTVSQVIRRGEFCYSVSWDNGAFNCYREGEIKLANIEAPQTPRRSPTLSQRIVEAKRKLKAHRDCGDNGIAIHLKKGAPIAVSRGPCHGFIRNEGRPSSQAIVSLLKRSGGNPGHNQCNGEVVVRYCDWLFNRSPWAECFKYKGAANAWKEKSCVLRVDVPANLLQGALISTRNTWEFPEHINLWHKLVTKYGVDEHIAFLAVYFVSISGESVVPSGCHRDHIAVSTRKMTEQGARAFLFNAPLYKRGAYNKNGNYEGVLKAFEGQGTEIFDKFREDFNKYGKEGVAKNPFGKAKFYQSNTRSMGVAQYAMFATEFFGKYRTG